MPESTGARRHNADTFRHRYVIAAMWQVDPDRPLNQLPQPLTEWLSVRPQRATIRQMLASARNYDLRARYGGPRQRGIPRGNMRIEFGVQGDDGETIWFPFMARIELQKREPAA